MKFLSSVPILWTGDICCLESHYKGQHLGCCLGNSAHWGVSTFMYWGWYIKQVHLEDKMASNFEHHNRQNNKTPVREKTATEFMAGKKKLSRNGKKGLVIKRLYWSCRGAKCNSKLPCHIAHSHLQYQAIRHHWRLRASALLYTDPHVDTTDICIIKNKTFYKI